MRCVITQLQKTFQIGTVLLLIVKVKAGEHTLFSPIKHVIKKDLQHKSLNSMSYEMVNKGFSCFRDKNSCLAKRFQCKQNTRPDVLLMWQAVIRGN